MLSIRRLLTSVAGVAVTGYLLLVSSSAFAMAPPDPPAGPPPPASGPGTTHIVEVGSPIWMFVLVAVVAALLTVAVDQMVTRSRQWSSSGQVHA